MKFSNKRKLEEILKRLNPKNKGKKLAKILFVKGQESFDTSHLEADIILKRPYNTRCKLPEGITYPESFKDGPVIIWSSI